MSSKHNDIGKMFKDNVLRVCFWANALIGVGAGLGAAQNMMNDHPDAAKSAGKVLGWSALTEAALLTAAFVTGKKLGIGGEKDVSFDEIDQQNASKKDAPKI